MIALLLISRTFAQEVPTEPPPAAPVPETPAPEPGWEPVVIEGDEPSPVVPEPVEVSAPAPVDEPAPADEPIPWVGSPRRERDGFLRYAIGAEIGSLANPDPAYDLFSAGNTMGSAGVALGFALAPRLSIVGSWQHYRHGARVSYGQSDTDADFESEEQSVLAAWTAHEGTLGLRLDASIGDVLFPYVAGRGLVLGGRMRLDDDRSVNDNPGQSQARGTTFGGMATAGIELRIPPQSDLQAAWTLELGNAWLARADFGKFGSMRPGGFVARSSLGLRF